MQLVSPDINLDFIGKKSIAFLCSALLIIASIATLVIHQGPRYGVDFAGGTLIQLRFDTAPEIAAIKKGIAAADLGRASVQRFGDAGSNEFLVRTEGDDTLKEGEASKDLSDTLKKAIGDATGQMPEIRRVEMVGPQVGKDLREKALLAIFFSLLFITIYISGRFELKWIKSAVTAGSLMGAVWALKMFNVSIPFLMIGALIVTLALFWFLEFKYAMGAIVALIHDVTITVGLFSIFDKEFTLPIIAALLTIIGYSLNDTIIVFDRIRENQRRLHKKPLAFIINRSINETLSRTILTSATTLFVLVALFLFGGGIIHDFAFAMIAGIVVGTYSSVYVASPILLMWQGKAAR